MLWPADEMEKIHALAARVRELELATTQEPIRTVLRLEAANNKLRREIEKRKARRGRS